MLAGCRSCNGTEQQQREHNPPHNIPFESHKLLRFDYKIHPMVLFKHPIGCNNITLVISFKERQQCGGLRYQGLYNFKRDGLLRCQNCYWVGYLTMRRLLAVGIPTLVSYRYMCEEKREREREESRESTISSTQPPPLKSRSEHLREIKESPEYDIVVIGGGCNGAGVALDASSRGLKTLLIESNDFGNGASSKSTKLIHGGLRYLQAVFVSTDSLTKRKENYQLVKEALNDRKFMIENASYMNSKLKFVIPYTSLFQQLYYYSGTLVYHLITWAVSGNSRKGLQFTFPYFIGQKDLKAYFPFISNQYQGGIVFEDGQFNDAQMLMSVLLTSTLPHNPAPANIINQAQFTSFSKDSDGRITGLTFKDKLSNEEIKVNSKYVVNCTGAFADKIRQIDNPEASKRLIPVAGSHLTFDRRVTPGGHGIIINSDDGRVLIVVPWLGKTIAGTTESKMEEPVLNPTITIDEKRFIYDQMNKVFDDIAPSELLRLERSSWTGIRPLVMEEVKDLTDTKQVSRKHVIERSKSGLISLMGGKWTIYRQMGEDVVDLVIKDMKKSDKSGRVLSGSRTSGLRLIGDDYSQTLQKDLVKKYGSVVGDHMFTTYGGIAPHILAGNNEVLDPEIGITKEEISYIVKYQMPTQIEDVVLRRTRVAFLDRRKPQLIVPFVADELGKVWGWTNEEKEAKIQEFYKSYANYEF